MTQEPEAAGDHLGYWDDSELTGRPSFWPDPRHLVVAWEPGEQTKIVGYLRAGHVTVAMAGMSWCRFGCPGANGSTELSDGVFTWPEGLAHYVAEHSVGLPDDFRQHAAANGYKIPTLRRGRAGRPARSNAFVLWAMDRSPEPAPRPGTLSLTQARARAAELSTARTTFSIEPFKGRWQIVGGHLDGFIPPLRADEFDELLASARAPVASISPKEATRIASSLSGPDVEITYAPANSDPLVAQLRDDRFTEDEVWLVSERSPFTRSAHAEQRQDALGVELYVAAARRRCEQMLAEPLTLARAASELGAPFTVTEVLRDGVTKWRIEHPRRTIEIDRPDRRVWEKARWEAYHAARRVPMRADEAEARLRQVDGKIRVVESGDEWTIIGAHAEGMVPPLGEEQLYPVIRDLKRAGDAKYAAMALEILRRR